MYLSRLMLNQRSRAVRRDLGDVQELHRTLMSIWEDGVTRENINLLFRVESFNRRPILLIQSSRSPDWDKLPDGYLDNSEDAQRVITLDGLTARLTSGARYRFRLFANPTRKLKVEGRKNGRRVAIRDEAALITWIERKLNDAGFDLDQDPFTELPSVSIDQSARQRGERQGQTITFDGVRFEGSVIIRDPNSAISALTRGVGSGKAYGYGLLSLAPL